MHKEAFDSIYNIQSLVPEVFDMDDEKFKNVMFKKHTDLYMELINILN